MSLNQDFPRDVKILKVLWVRYRDKILFTVAYDPFMLWLQKLMKITEESISTFFF